MKKSRRSTTKKKNSPKATKQHKSRLKYLKLLPAVLLLAISVVVQTSSSITAVIRPAVLSYATSISVSGLLASTNDERSANGVAGLALNSALNNAAQAKANDMVTRDYFSHETPDGQQPWVFITQAGYAYIAAGENLAHGFATSGDTITGWMNSPGHKANLLKTSFHDVGFGIANSPNYVGTGEKTLVVAMYGATNSSSPPATAPATVAQAPPAPTATPKAAAPVAEVTPAAEPIETVPTPEPVTTPEPETPPVAATASPMKVRRIQLLTGGNAVWSATLLVVSLCSIGILWVIHRGLHFKRLILTGERFVLHHLHMDFTVLAVLILGWSLLGTSGIIR